MKKRLLIITMLMLFVMILPQVSAQDDALTDEELELITYVADAYNKVVTMDSAYITGIQTVEQVIVAQGQEVVQDIVQEISGWITYEDLEQSNADLTIIQSLVQTIGIQEVEVDLSMDMRIIEGTLYVRVYDLAAELQSFFPEGWVNVNEDGASVPGFELINPDQLSNVASSGLIIPFTEDTVLSIEELEGETLESGETRVFVIEVDGLALLEFEEMQESLGMLNEQPGVDMEALMQDMMGGAIYTVTAWIDPEEDILVQTEVILEVDADIEMLGQSMNLVQTTTGLYTYSEFGEPVEIEVPEIDDF